MLSRGLVLVYLLVAIATWKPRSNALNVGKFMMMKRRGETTATMKSASSETVAPSSSSVCDEMLTKSLAIANEAKTVAEREKEAAVEAQQTALVEIETLKGALQSTSETLESQVDELLTKLSVAEKEHEEKIEAMNKEILDQSHKIRSEARKLVEKAETARDEKVKEVLLAMDELRAETTRQLEAGEQDAVSKLAELVAEQKQILDQKNVEMTTIAAELKSEMRSIEEKAMRDAESLTNRFSIRQQEIESESEEKIANLTLEHANQVSEYTRMVGKLEQVSESWKTRYEELEAKHATASQELAEFQALQVQRSYCNFTYIQEDALSAATKTQQQVKEHLSVAAEHASKAARQVSEKAAVVAAPHLQKSRDLYDQSVKPHVDQHVTPVLGPVVEKADIHLRELATILSNAASVVHKSLVDRYTVDCPKARERLESMEGPAFLIEHVTEACEDPEGSVNRYLTTVGVILIFVFRGFLWRTLKAVVLFPFRFLWFFFPLRFLFKSNAQPGVEDDDLDISPIKADPVKSSPSQ